MEIFTCESCEINNKTFRRINVEIFLTVFVRKVSGCKYSPLYTLHSVATMAHKEYVTTLQM